MDILLIAVGIGVALIAGALAAGFVISAAVAHAIGRGLGW
jgi:hypothetical protein